MLALSGIIYAAAAAAPHLARAYTEKVAAMSDRPFSVYAAKSSAALVLSSLIAEIHLYMFQL